MSSWKTVTGKGRSTHKRTSTSKSKTFKALTESEVEDFLGAFKTEACTDSEFHDFRLRRKYHSDKDWRRSPYQLYYPATDSLNATEKMYHPSIFRTYRCQEGDPACEFGAICAHAHSTMHLRSRIVADRNYEDRMKEVTTPSRNFSSFVPSTAPARNYEKECESVWRENQLTPSTTSFRLTESQWFLLSRSTNLFRKMEDVAFEDGLSCIQKRFDRGETSLLVKGFHAESLMFRLREMLVPPSSCFGIAQRKYGERVISKLKSVLENDGQEKFSSSRNVVVEIVSNESLRVTSVGSILQQETLTHEVLDKIDFWTAQEAVQSQILHIRKREHWLVCPQCQGPYDLRDVAAHVPNRTLVEVLQSVVDKSVEKERTAISEEFDRKLESKVEELISNYGNAGDHLKNTAQNHALQIRNSILNLSCPHCGIAYAEFTGCMALKCASCERNFCAYCHEKFSTASGTHEHVRLCLMNDTETGSYYANDIQIKRAQRRYRTREQLS